MWIKAINKNRKKTESLRDRLSESAYNPRILLSYKNCNQAIGHVKKKLLLKQHLSILHLHISNIIKGHDIKTQIISIL